MEKTCIEEQKFQSICFPKYFVTFDRITDRLTEVFSPAELKEYLRLYELAKKEPKKAKKPIEDFFENYPALPEIYNLLSYVYIRLKKIRKVENLIKLNYERNTKDLFARINYADQCLRKKKSYLIPQIFNEQYDLNKLYPEKKAFHYSEIMGFMTLMGFYTLSKDDKESAKDYCIYAKMIDPEDTAVRLLEKKIRQISLSKRFKEKLLRLRR